MGMEIMALATTLIALAVVAVIPKFLRNDNPGDTH